MINGSPRAKSNTSLTLAEMEQIFRLEGIEAETAQVGHRFGQGQYGLPQGEKLQFTNFIP